MKKNNIVNIKGIIISLSITFDKYNQYYCQSRYIWNKV